jgi:hypothetical protein
MLLCFHHYLGNGNRRSLALVGTLLGIMALMKVEVTFACAVAVGIGFIVSIYAKGNRGSWYVDLGILAAGAIFPLLGAFVCLWSAMPADQAIRGLLGSWKYLRDPLITANLFYRKIQGVDEPLHNTAIMLRLLVEQSALLAIAAIVAILVRRRWSSRAQFLAALTMSGTLLGITILCWDRFGWQAAMRPLHMLAIASAIIWSINIVRTPRDQITPRLLMRLVFSVFSLGLLAKIFFKVAIFHYGFALAAPAFALLVMALVAWLPAALEMTGGSPCVFRAAALTLLAAFCVKHLLAFHHAFGSLAAHPVGSRADEFLVFSKAAPIQNMIAFVEHLPAGQTLATVPEGSMLNYLTRRVNPTGETTLLPGEVFMFGEARVTQRFTQHPPDWIITINSDTARFGYKGFGIDYAKDLSGWIQSNYSDVTPIGMSDRTISMHLLKHEPPMKR